MKALCLSTQRQTDGGTTTKPSASSSSSGWQASSWWQSSSWSQTSRWGWTIFFKVKGVSNTGNLDSFVSDGECKHYTQPTDTSHSRTRVFLVWLETWVIESGFMVSHKTVILHNYHSMSHAPSSSHLSTTSLSTCTPARPSTRPSTRPMSSSHGELPCADPSNVSFALLAETHSPTKNGG